MRKPCCPRLRAALGAAARERFGETRVRDGGIEAVTDGQHFESRAEIKSLGRLGSEVVGQSLCPEIYLAREIGSCYGRLEQVVNRAEGVGEDWRHEELAAIFHDRAVAVGRLMLEVAACLPARSGCSCRDLRQATLLKGTPPPSRAKRAGRGQTP